MKKLQTSWFQEWEMKDSVEKRHGGDIRKGLRKVKRPLDSRKPLHLVLKSSKARGELNFLRPRNREIVDAVIAKQAKRFGIKIERFANVGNHLHAMIRFKHREYFQNFLRAITTLIARKVTDAKRSKAFGKFWDALAFTRVVDSKLGERYLRTYIQANVIEAQFGPQIRAEYLQQEARKRRGGGRA